jgi:predicted permease
MKLRFAFMMAPPSSHPSDSLATVDTRGGAWKLAAVDTALAVLDVVGPVFLVAGVGALFAHYRSIRLQSVTDVLFYVLVPALVFSTMSRTELAPGALLQMALAAVGVNLVSFALGWTALRLQGRQSAGYLLVCTFANNANMGMSLGALAFGDLGLALATAYYATSALLTFSLGLRVASGHGALREMLRVPFIYAAAIGLAVKLLSVPVPEVIARGSELLGQAAIPCMLFALGYRLRTVPLQSLGLAAQTVGIRVGGGLLAGLAVAALLGATGTERAVILLQAAMPAAVINFVLAERYDRDPALVSSAIALGTLASVVTLPLLVGWLLAP